MSWMNLYRLACDEGRRFLHPDPVKGHYVQPDDFDPEREAQEKKNRTTFAIHFNYADPKVGARSTYDPKGNYNCGRCRYADGTNCLLVKTSINRKAGSCGDWDGMTTDPVSEFRYKTKISSTYGVAKNGEGFGCHRCPYSTKSKKPDSDGRNAYCGKGDFRVFPNACCVLNGAPVRE